MNSLFKEFSYIYASTKNFEEDRNFYLSVLKSRLVWEFTDREAKVAAFDLTGFSPYLLIADHRHTPTARFLYRVENLKNVVAELKANGLELEGEQFELPDGPCVGFSDHSGNSFGIFEEVRPQALVKEFEKVKRG